jgi:hypothetical protein
MSLPFPFRSLSSPIDADVEADVGPTVSLSSSLSHQAVHSLGNPIAMRRAPFGHSPSPAPHPPLSRAHSVTPANGRSTGASGQGTALSRGPSLNRQGSVDIRNTRSLTSGHLVAAVRVNTLSSLCRFCEVFSFDHRRIPGSGMEPNPCRVLISFPNGFVPDRSLGNCIGGETLRQSNVDCANS